MGDNDTAFVTPWLPLNNQTQTFSLVYVFTPAGKTTKRALCVTFLFLGAMGFLGNYCIFYFLGKQPKRGVTKKNPFVTNLNLYIRTLSLSDLLNSAVCAPLISIQISFDVFQSGWACKMVRYVNFLFPAITINSLIVICLQKYLATRNVLRTVSTRSMRKMVIYAWVFGALFMLLPTATYEGKKVALNNTHFTVICKNNEHFFPFRTTWFVLPLQYVLPTMFITYVNVCLVKTMWDSGRQVAAVTRSDFQAELRIKKIKGTILLIAFTFSFIIPFFFFLANVAYTQIARPRRDFATEYAFRYGSGCIVYLSAVMNFAIYFVQVRSFREFVIGLIFKRNSNKQRSDVVVPRAPGVIFKAERQSVAGMRDKVDNKSDTLMSTL